MGKGDRFREVIVMKILLEAEDLEAGYSAPVVGPISFSVRQGEVVGLWGANGTGKSTLLNIIGNGARVLGGRMWRAEGFRLSYQEQHPTRLREMPLTAREFLHFAQADQEAIPERIQPWLDKRIDRLSGGQFQLLTTWATLATDCDLVILDEPTNSLDPEGEAILASILRSHQGSRSVLLVSHEQEFLREACSRTIEIA
jgi:zinc transport system ATP-binding protein